MKMKTRRIVISAFLAVFLSTAVFADETNPVEKKETTSNEVQKESKDSGGVIYYGEKAGLFRPCKGTCVFVCKVITKDNENGTATVSDGKNTIVVDIEKVNFEDGSVDM